MKYKIRAGLALAVLLTVCAAAALAADAFRFEQKSIELFEGESVNVALIREGAPAGDGTLTFTSGNTNAVSVAADGTITARAKGTATVKAVLKSGGRSWSAALTVKVLRPVTAVTLNTTKLQVYRPTDARVAGLLRSGTGAETPEDGESAEPLNDVILISAGKSAELKAACTPSDASNKKVIFTSTDEGVLKVNGANAKALQAGECDLIVSSASNPEVRQTWHVLVIQPVTKLTVISDSGKTVNAGGTLRLRAAVEPANAAIQDVVWSSRSPQTAAVDQDGVVTGIKRGAAVIEAKAADGSGKSATIQITVGQKPTSVEIRESSLYLSTGQNGYVHATVYPQDANEKGVIWSSSDPGVATVTAAGQVKGVSRGTCSIIATCRGSTDVTAEIPVQVVQKVTNIVFLESKPTLPIRTTLQLNWIVMPYDADIRDVVFSSSNQKVATVDENGLVTGLTRGTSTITAAATDGSNRRGQVRVTVTQPVEGVSIQYGVYHIQLEGSLNVKAVIRPSNANNQNVHFTTGDEYVATVRDQKNIGRVRGLHEGTTILTGVTEDGGYSAQAEIRVADFNRAVVVDDVYLEGENIRICLRNRSGFTVDRVYFTVETFDRDGKPLVCNTDGVSNSFKGAYRLSLGPGERSEHYRFDFGDYVQPTESIAIVNVTVTGWRDAEGYTRNIPEEERPNQSYRRFMTADGPDGNG